MITGKFPTSLQTKSDFIYAIKNVNPHHAIQLFQDLLDSVPAWINVGKTTNGISNDTNKIVNNYQYSYTTNPNCRLYRLGFTIEEVQNIIEYLKGLISIWNTETDSPSTSGDITPPTGTTQVTVIIN